MINVHMVVTHRFYKDSKELDGSRAANSVEEALQVAKVWAAELRAEDREVRRAEARENGFTVATYRPDVLFPDH